MKQSTFIAALKFASHAAAKKDVRYYLNSVLFEVIDHNNLTMVGTDGHRMAVIHLVEDSIDMLPGQYIIPADDVSVMLKLFDAKASWEITFSAKPDDTLVFATAHRRHTFKPMDARYPDWRRVARLGDEPQPQAVYKVNGDYLAASAKACAALGGKYAGVNITTYGDQFGTIKLSAADISMSEIGEAYAIVMPMRK